MYEIKPEQQKRLDNDFTYHKTLAHQPARYSEIRNEVKNLAHMILCLTPPSREQSLAMTKLEEAVMWANAAIARNEKEPAPT